MSRRPKRLAPTFVDYLAIAIGPLLVGLLVGSLVFFLIEVFYEGPFEARLQFIMAMFVVAAVGIARISIEEGREYATLFAVPLGVLIAIAAWRLVEFRGPLAAVSPLLSIGLVAIIWWSTDRLIWDCTVLEEREGEEDGVGLLQTAGLDGSAGDDQPAAAVLAERSEGVTTHEPPRMNFWERFVEMRRRPHAPGVWVLLFSLAALPIFGLGQKLLPAGSDASRRFVFLLLVVYVASGLALLLLTSFLSLRQYLRQRRLPMPATMAAAWIVSGAALIAAVLVACLFLPQRTRAYALVDLPRLPWQGDTPDDRAPSTWAVGQDGRDDERADRTVSRDDAERTRPGQADGEHPPAGDTKASPEQQAGHGDPRGTEPPAGGGDPSGTEQRPRGEQQAGSREQAAPRKNGADPEHAAERADVREPSQAGDPPEAHAANESAAGEPNAAGERATDASAKPATGAPSPPPSWSPLTTGLPAWLRAAAVVVAMLVAAVVAWIFRDQIVAFLAGLRDRLADLWNRLFGGRRDRPPPAPAPATPPRRRTFAEFSDPFVSGAADRTEVDELIRYSFLAFEAWCGDRGHVRPPHQTVHEFTHSVGSRREDVAREARLLAELVSCSSYGRQAVSRSQIEPLRRLWQRMRG